jgi:hypothetical protein
MFSAMFGSGCESLKFGGVAYFGRWSLDFTARYLLLSIVSNSNLPSSHATTKPRRSPSTNIANAFGLGSSLPNKTSRHLNSPAFVTSAR